MKYVSVKSEDQLEAVLETNAADAIICPFVPSKAQAGDMNFYLALPDAARQNQAEMIKEMILSAKAVIIQNIDELGMLRELKFEGETAGGELLYAGSSEAVRFYRRFFPDMKFIASAELTDTELKKLEKAAKASFIYKVYGCQKLMTTAQYLDGNFSDEKGEKFFAVYNDVYNYSEIYMHRPVSMLDKPSAWEGHDILFEFTRESPTQIRKILETMSADDFIRGHHYRGTD